MIAFALFSLSDIHAPSEHAVPRVVSRGSFPIGTTSEVCSIYACLTASSHLDLVIYVYDLGVRRLSFIRGSGGSTVSYVHKASSSHCVCVFDIYEVYI